MLTLENQSNNEVTVVGKLLDCQVNTGTNTSGVPYARANTTIRVAQDVNGRTEISEVPVSFYANMYKRDGSISKAYESITAAAHYKTAVSSGIDNAEVVAVTLGSLQENYYVSRSSGQLIDGWQIRAPFMGQNSRLKEAATFKVTAFILDMKDEVDREGDTTGRLIIKGAVVQYGGKLDVIEFIVENPDHVNYISRSWNVNDTVVIKGRIRYCTKETQKVSSSSWGENLESTTTVTVRELIVTSGSDEPFEDDFAYDAKEIKKGFSVRKANVEQKLSEAKLGQQVGAKKKTTAEDWEM